MAACRSLEADQVVDARQRYRRTAEFPGGRDKAREIVFIEGEHQVDSHRCTLETMDVQCQAADQNVVNAMFLQGCERVEIEHSASVPRRSVAGEDRSCLRRSRRLLSVDAVLVTNDQAFDQVAGLLLESNLPSILRRTAGRRKQPDLLAADLQWRGRAGCRQPVTCSYLPAQRASISCPCCWISAARCLSSR